MPDGKGHDTITVVTAILVAPAAIWYFGPVAIAGVAGLLFGALAFSPDLDLDSDEYDRWGPFKYYWWLYQWAVPHRGQLSHGPVIGTLARLIYIAPVIAVVVGAFVVTGVTSLPEVEAWALKYKPYLISTVIGLEANSLIHIVADGITTWFKRKF